MALDRTKLKFGGAVAEQMNRNTPTEEEVLARPDRFGANFDNPINRNTRTPEELQGIDIQRLRAPIEITFANDPKELDKQKTLRRIDQRVEDMSADLYNENPNYARALGGTDNEHEQMNGFMKSYYSLDYATRVWSRKEEIIEDELPFFQEEARRVRNTLRAAEFVASWGQDIVKAVAGGIAGNIAEGVNNGWAQVTGKEDPNHIIWQSDSFWWKLLYGRETTRDHFGRVTSSKGRDVASTYGRAFGDQAGFDITEESTGSAKMMHDMFGTGDPADLTPTQKVKYGAAGLLGSGAMTFLELDLAILPIATFQKGMTTFALKTATTKGIVDGLETLMVASGKTVTSGLKAEFKKVAQEALKKTTAADAQKVVNDFIRANVDEGSNAARVVNNLDEALRVELEQSRATLDELASKAPDLPSFQNGVREALISERATQARNLTKHIARVVNDPVFTEATQRVEQIFKEFGTGLTDADIIASRLREDTPTAIKEEFDAIKKQLSDVTDNTLVPLETRLAALAPSVEIGRGSSDLTRHLLDADGGDLDGLTKKIFDEVSTRADRAVKAANFDPISGKSADDILDTLDSIARNITERRTAGSTSDVKLTQFLNAEAIARGAFGRQVAEAAVAVPAKVAKKVKQAPAVSPVNKEVFDNIKLSAGDTLLKAADDVTSSKSFEDFVKNSEEVVYQSLPDTTFVREKSISEGLIRGEIHPPMVLDMKQPLRLDKADDLKTALMARQVLGSVPLGQVITPEQAIKILTEVAPALGFDGVIYKQVVNGVETTGRAVLNKKQIIPAASFYDNIKGGVDVMGDGVALSVRRQSQVEDVLEKMLPKTPAMKNIYNFMTKLGLPETLAKKTSMEIHAHLLDNFLSDAKNITSPYQASFDVIDDAGNALNVSIEPAGLVLKTQIGAPVVVKTKKELDTVFKNVIKSFKDDAQKRVDLYANSTIAGGITEAKFVAKGPGHKSFNDMLKQRVNEGMFLPEEAMLVRIAMKDVKDSLMKNIPLLESSEAYRAVETLGAFSWTASKGAEAITMARGLAYMDLRRSVRKGSKLYDAGHLGTETFLHEFGHLGHKTLLSPDQLKVVTKVYNSLSRKEIRDFFNAGSTSRVATTSHVLSNEDEFFAQAFADYTIKNRLVHSDLVPLFQRITNQLKHAVGSLFTKPSTIAKGKVDALNPLFDQILRGESAAQRKAVKEVEQTVYSKQKIGRSSIDGGDGNFAGRQPITSRKAVTDAQKLMEGSAKGRGIPAYLAKEVKNAPPAPPKKTFQVDKAPESSYLDAKVPKDINKIDIKDPDLSAKLDDVEVFGKGTRVHRSLREGQKKLAATVKKMQGSLIRQDQNYADTIGKLRDQRDAAIARTKQKFADAEEMKKTLMNQVKHEEAALASFGAKFTSASMKEIATMASKVKTEAQLRKALSRMEELSDNTFRTEAKKRITKVASEVERGTRKVPPVWQDRIEDMIKDTSIRLKLFRVPYEERLTKLKEFLDKEAQEIAERVGPEKADSAIENMISPKTLRMVQDLQELAKIPVTKFQTSQLVKLTRDIEKLLEEGEAAQFVIKGGKTKEISRPMLGKDANGKPVIKKFIIQKGGEYVDGLEKLLNDNRVAEITDAAKGGAVKNLDHNYVEKEYGDLEAGGFNGLMDGLAAMKDNPVEQTKKVLNGDFWQRGLMTYLTADRVVELMDNMMPNGPIAQLVMRPLRSAINRGELKSNKAVKGIVDKEAELTAKYKLKGGKGGTEKPGLFSRTFQNGFTDANYERIAIHAYLKQGLKGKLTNLVSEKDIAKVQKEGLMPHEVEMYDYMREELDKLWPGLDNVMRDEHGVRISKIENYFPIQNNILDNRTMSEVLNIEYIPSKRAIARGFTESRLSGVSAQLKMNAREIFKKHVRDVNYFTEVEPQIQRAAKITRDKQFVDNVGKNASLWFEEYLDITARRGTPKNYSHNLWDVWRKNMGAATLGFNPSPVIKQWLAAFAGLGVIGPRAVAEGYGLMVKDRKIFDAIANVSIEQKLRAADDPAFTDLSLSGKLSQAQQIGYSGIRFMDSLTARGIWLGAYKNQLRKSGKQFNADDFKNQIGIDDEALAYADMIVRKTQGSGKFQDLPLLLTNKDKKIFTYLFQFQSFVLSQSQLVTHDALHSLLSATFGSSEKGAAQAMKEFTAIVGTVGFSIYLEQEISKWLADKYGSDATKKYLEDQTLEGRFEEGLQSAFPPYGLVADFINPDNPNIGAPVIDKVWKGAKAASLGFFPPEGTTKETEAKAKVKGVESALSVFLGVPGTSFAGQLIKNLVVENSFDTPVDALNNAIMVGDQAEFQYLLTQYHQQGLDTTEILQSVKSSQENKAKSERKDLVNKLAEMIQTADTPKKQSEVQAMMKELEANGELTPQHLKELKSKLTSDKRKASIGEI